MTAWTNCADCGDPVALYSTNFYRCRSCGFESLRDVQPYERDERAYIAASLDLDVRQLTLPLRPEVPTSGARRDARALGLSLSSTSHKKNAAGGKA